WDRLLKAGQKVTWRNRHLSHFTTLAEEGGPQLQGGPEQSMWLRRLEREHDNLRTALDWGSQDDAALGGGATSLRLAAALWSFWRVRSYFAEGREHLRRALRSQGARARTSVRAKALNGMGSLVYCLGDYADARALLEESLGISRDLGDRKSIAASLNNLGLIRYQRGEY